MEGCKVCVLEGVLLLWRGPKFFLGGGTFVVEEGVV